MNVRNFVLVVSVMSFGFGIAKIFRPQFFLKLRETYPWFNVFDIYSSVFKSIYAERLVRFNGILLVAIAIGLCVWWIHN